MWAWVKRKRKEWLIDSVDELFQVFFESCMNNKVVWLYVLFVRHFANTQKPILCSADAPQILMHAGVVKGRRMTCIHHLHQDLKDAGAVLYDTGVVNDNNLYISSQTQYDLPAFIQESLLVLNR